MRPAGTRGAFICCEMLWQAFALPNRLTPTVLAGGGVHQNSR